MGVDARTKQGRRGRQGGVPMGVGVSVGPMARRGGTNEVQTITVSAATGGHILVTIFGKTTGQIAHTATATQVRDAILAALNPAGQAVEYTTADLAASGGPLNTAAVTLTFQGKLGRGNVPEVVLTNNTTGGGTAVAGTTTPGVSQHGPAPDSISSFVGPQSHSGGGGVPFYQHPSRRG